MARRQTSGGCVTTQMKLTKRVFSNDQGSVPHRGAAVMLLEFASSGEGNPPVMSRG